MHVTGRASPLCGLLSVSSIAVPSAPLFSESQTHRFSARYSHSMVLGGFELMSYTTRVTPGTSFTIRVEMRSSTSPGNLTQSAVMASSDSTTLTATVNP